MTPWWRNDGKLMKNWWWTDEALMKNWWRTDGALMKIQCRNDEEMMKLWWRTHEELMKNCWKTDDELITNWWQIDEVVTKWSPSSHHFITIESIETNRSFIIYSMKVDCSTVSHQTGTIGSTPKEVLWYEMETFGRIGSDTAPQSLPQWDSKSQICPPPLHLESNHNPAFQVSPSGLTKEVETRFPPQTTTTTGPW